MFAPTFGRTNVVLYLIMTVMPQNFTMIFIKKVKRNMKMVLIGFMFRPRRNVRAEYFSSSVICAEILLSFHVDKVKLVITSFANKTSKTMDHLQATVYVRSYSFEN